MIFASTLVVGWNALISDCKNVVICVGGLAAAVGALTIVSAKAHIHKKTDRAGNQSVDADKLPLKLLIHTYGGAAAEKYADYLVTKMPKGSFKARSFSHEYFGMPSPFGLSFDARGNDAQALLTWLQKENLTALPTDVPAATPERLSSLPPEALVLIVGPLTPFHETKCATL